MPSVQHHHVLEAGVVSYYVQDLSRFHVMIRIRYDTLEDFNVDSKAECDQLNLAHVGRKIYIYIYI